MDYRDASARTSSFITEVAIIALAVMLGYMFWDGLLTVNATLHMLGLR